MKFFISRASDRRFGSTVNQYEIVIYGDDEEEPKPHERAYFDGECWCININTLEELLELKKEVGDIILSTRMKHIYEKELDGLPKEEIEMGEEIYIYDDWIE